MRNLARCLKPTGRLIVIHLAGSDHINAFHASINGPVASDYLPQGSEWNSLLAQAGLRHDRLIDRKEVSFAMGRPIPPWSRRRSGRIKACLSSPGRVEFSSWNSRRQLLVREKVLV
ncbi:MAG: hypothetical protein QF577_04530 [Phycisphaerae bacterium]|jgi:hypothetical protein|nr:hypothetical protein [Phycisphaerae bacterium]